MARTGLNYLRDELRGMTNAGTADFTAGTVSWFTDTQLDTVLDGHSWIYSFWEVEPALNKVTSGVLESYDYYLPGGNWEENATDEFYLQNVAGGTISSSSYTVDYKNGIVSFTANTAGTIYFFTGTRFDLNSAAAEIWRKKAGFLAGAYNFSTDNNQMSREPLQAHCLKMADYYAREGEGAVGSSTMVRDDTD